VFFAWVFRIRTVIHEQNVIPGRANRLLAYLVDEIAIGFAKTKNYFGMNSFKVTFTGNPLKPGLAQIEKARAYEFLGLDSNKFTILVMGGSQGAHRINTIFVKAVNLIKHKSDFEIIHLCGEKDQLFLSNSYKDLSIKAKAFSFLGPMEYAYSAADIVISRAGAASISEIAFFGLPSVLISYPYVRGHQMKNAGYLCENNAAILIEEKDLYPEGLRDRILELFNNPGLRESMAKNVLMFSKPRADESLADLVLEEAQAYGAQRHKPDG